MDKSTEGRIEINQTIYECDRDLAELLEWLRLEEVRVKIYKSVKSKPYVGYIRQRKRRIPGGGTISRPVIVYNRRCFPKGDLVVQDGTASPIEQYDD